MTRLFSGTKYQLIKVTQLLNVVWVTFMNYENGLAVEKRYEKAFQVLKKSTDQEYSIVIWVGCITMAWALIRVKLRYFTGAKKLQIKETQMLDFSWIICLGIVGSKKALG